MTRPPIGPEDRAMLRLRKVLIKAQGDSTFRASFLRDPKAAAKTIYVDLTDADVAELATVHDDLIRFSSAAGVQEADVRHWATGILLRRVTCAITWSPSVLSIQRYAFSCVDSENT